MTDSATSQPTVLARLNAPRDPAGLAMFRILFGAVMMFSVLRFWVRGWIETLYLGPDYHFKYFGFEWVEVPAPWALYLLFVVMLLAAFGIMIGWRARICALIFAAVFTYVELLDKTTYLNHYYFVSLASFLLALTPCDAAWSVSARLRGASAQVPAWSYGILRIQLAVVYCYAGFAKLNGDWLGAGMPLDIWLDAHSDAPLVGTLMGTHWFAMVMSWLGAGFDLTVPLFLSWRRTRPYAYAAAVGFHVSVWLLFPIGVFSWVMLSAITIFAPPDWPRRFVPRRWREPCPDGPVRGRVASLGAVLMAIYLAIQLLVPLRFLCYPGHVNWTEQGFRFSWRVMLIEKVGHLEFRVHTDRGSYRVLPRRELTPLQYKMMATQADMIQEYALHVARRYRALGHADVRVFADSYISFNGRPSRQFIDPSVDLAATRPGFAHKDWILPLHRHSAAGYAARGTPP